MTKKRNRATRSRDAPQKRETSWLCSADAYKVLIGNGYTRLADCPEVQMCVDVYADLISSMTLHLSRTQSGDVRVKRAVGKVTSSRTDTTQILHIISSDTAADGDGNHHPRFDPVTARKCEPPNHPLLFYAGDLPDDVEPSQPDEVLFYNTDLSALMELDTAPWKDVVKGLKQAGATKQSILESPAPSIIVKVDGLTDEFASVEGRKKLSAQYLDSSENGQPWFIPAEAFSVEQVKPLTLNDLAIAKNIELDKRTAAAILRVPAFLVGVGEYKKDEYNAFINHSIMPLAQSIQQELTRKLLYSPDLYWRFNPRSLYAYDISEIVAAGSAMVDRMAMRRNEWRDWLGMGPDDEMDDLLALENYIPAEMLGQQKKLIGGDEQ